MPIERAARALARLDGNPEATKFEGRPMWESYLDQVRVVLEAVRDLDTGTCLDAFGHPGSDLNHNKDVALYQGVIDALLHKTIRG